MESFYATSDVCGLAIKVKEKEFDFDVAKKVDIIESHDKSIIFIESEVMNDEIESLLKENKCELLVRTHCYGSGKVHYATDYVKKDIYKDIKLIRKISYFRNGNGSVNECIYILSNNDRVDEITEKIIENYLRERMADKLSNSIASLGDILNDINASNINFDERKLEDVIKKALKSATNRRYKIN